jgi:hypothetical protein
MARLWQTRDPIGREVILTQLRRVHNLVQHAETTKLLGVIRVAIGHPDLVTRDV